jgi:8-oxo-dGTP diphosphatase
VQVIQTVSALLVNCEGRVLLQQRDHTPGIRFPGCWSTFGGGVEPGETPDAAMRRELLEELTLEAVPEMRLWKVVQQALTVDSAPVLLEIYVYVGRLDVDAAALAIHEGQAARYLGLDDLDGLPFAFGFELLFREFFAMTLRVNGMTSTKETP